MLISKSQANLFKVEIKRSRNGELVQVDEIASIL
jgi:hypothetical protein